MSALTENLRRLHTQGHATAAELKDESGVFTSGAYRPAAVLAAITERERPGFLFIHRPSNMRAHPGQVAFPGGKIDRGDAGPVDTALREAEEEIGLDPSFVETVGRLPQYLSGTGFRIVPVLSVVRRGFVIKPNPDEVDAVFEVPLSFLMNPDNHQRDSRLWQGIVRHFYVMPYGERHIWGITAGIIRTLYERLYA